MVSRLKTQKRTAFSSQRILDMICSEEGEWLAKGLGSTHGTVLISGVDHAKTVIEAPRDQRDMNSETETVVPIHLGDELLLASNTRFIVLEGIPKR